MISLILLLIFGSAITFLSLQNTTLVQLSFLNYNFNNIPLFYVIIGSILFGVLGAYIINVGNSVLTAIAIRGKDKKIKNLRQELNEVVKTNHQLEIKIAALCGETNSKSAQDIRSL